MATIDEILDAMPEEEATTGRDYLTIDPGTRSITVPESERVFGVEGDEDAARKYFICPRYVGDGLDLAGMFLTVYWRNANGDEDGTLVNDVEIQGDYVTFSWLLPEKAVAYRGALQFSVCADLPNTATKRRPDWNTTTASGEVLEGLDPDPGDVEAGTSDVVTQLRAEIVAGTAAVEAAGAAQVQNVQAEGSAQVNTVKATGAQTEADALAAIKAQGAATLATIPADYTTLTNRAARLRQEKADAYMVTTEATTASHEIHAQDCVLQAEVHGVTYRDGTGDPSTDNVRKIIGLGSYDAVLVLDGTEEWVAATNYAANTARLESVFGGGICKAGTCSHFAPLTPSTLKDGTRGAYMMETAKLFINYGTVAELKAYLAAQYAAGTPVTVWYQKATHDKTDPYYVRAWTEDAAGGYRATAAEVGPAPLFDGDTVELWVRSGCDKKVVLTGTENVTLNNAEYWTGTRSQFLVYPNADDMGDAVLSDRAVASAWPLDSKAPLAITPCGPNRIYFGGLIPLIGSTVESVQAYLAAQYAAGTPVTIWYRSTEYTEDNDLPVCLVTRTHHLLVFDGTEAWRLGNYDGTILVRHRATNMPPADIWNKPGLQICSHFRAGSPGYQTDDCFSMDANPDCCVQYSGATTVEEWTAYLAAQAAAGTPVQVLYPLAKPETYAFDAAALRSLHSLPETVQASGLLSVTYPQDTNYTLQRLVGAIQALGGTI